MVSYQCQKRKGYSTITKTGMVPPTFLIRFPIWQGRLLLPGRVERTNRHWYFGNTCEKARSIWTSLRTFLFPLLKGLIFFFFFFSTALDLWDGSVSRCVGRNKKKKACDLQECTVRTSTAVHVKKNELYVCNRLSRKQRVRPRSKQNVCGRWLSNRTSNRCPLHGLFFRFHMIISLYLSASHFLSHRSSSNTLSPAQLFMKKCPRTKTDGGASEGEKKKI